MEIVLWDIWRVSFKPSLQREGKAAQRNSGVRNLLSFVGAEHWKACSSLRLPTLCNAEEEVTTQCTCGEYCRKHYVFPGSLKRQLLEPAGWLQTWSDRGTYLWRVLCWGGVSEFTKHIRSLSCHCHINALQICFKQTAANPLIPPSGEK